VESLGPKELVMIGPEIESTNKWFSMAALAAPFVDRVDHGIARITGIRSRSGSGARVATVSRSELEMNA
jgi:hypothetical protein